MVFPPTRQVCFCVQWSSTLQLAVPKLRGVVPPSHRPPAQGWARGLAVSHQAICGRRIRAPKGVYAQIPRSCEHVRVHGKGEVSSPIGGLWDGETV